jgi:APA family basic amino acid/polyamine antiporter
VAEAKTLERALGLPTLTFYGVGIILGAGIYSVIGVAAGPAQNALWLSFLISAVVAFLTALSYAELATAYPQASAEFAYVRRAFPQWPGAALVIGLVVALSGAATAATVAIAFGGYLRELLDIHPMLSAAGLIVLATVVNLVGVKEAAWVNVAFTLIEVGGLVGFTILGASSERFGEAILHAPPAGVVAGAALVFFSFLGFENIANLAEEAKNPKRDLPRAIFLSLIIASVLYVLVALAALALLSPTELSQSEAPLSAAVRGKAKWMAGALGGVALFATANTALVSILGASRVLFGIARERELPESIAAISRRKTPWLAILTVAGVSALLLPFGSVGVVASVSSFASLSAFTAVNVALIVLRFREPTRERPFRIPGSIGRFVVLPAIAAAATVGVATQLPPTALITGAITTLAFGVYAFAHHKIRAAKSVGNR